MDLEDPISGQFNDIEISADISGNTYSGSATIRETALADITFATDSEGPVDGVFYGLVGESGPGPDETGAGLTIEGDGSEAFITGAIGATQVD